MIPYIIQYATPQEDIRSPNVNTGCYVCEDDHNINEHIIATIIEDMNEFLAEKLENSVKIESYHDFIKAYDNYYNFRVKCYWEIYNVRYFDVNTNRWVDWDIENGENQSKIYNAYKEKYYQQ